MTPDVICIAALELDEDHGMSTPLVEANLCPREDWPKSQLQLHIASYTKSWGLTHANRFGTFTHHWRKAARLRVREARRCSVTAAASRRQLYGSLLHV